MTGVVSVFESKFLTLQTTRSWDFLGIDKGKPINSGTNSQSHLDDLLIKANFGQDVIIGLVDSGIWPESPSFHDGSLPPIPTRWKGTCEVGDQFHASQCNRKLIGARYYTKGYEQQFGPINATALGDYLSTRDVEGHGSHTSSTAAGNFVTNASTYGFGDGIARGGAPFAKIAMYKTCWRLLPNPETNSTCTEADLLAAMDDAINDGVNIFSISLGVSGPQPRFVEDGLAIGAFHAIAQGIPVISAAGNDGPTPATLSSVAPWMLAVAASTIDRSFPSPVILGNGTILKGQSLSPYKLADKFFPLIFGGDAAIDNNTDSSACVANTLDPKKVQGKIVLCMRGSSSRADKAQEVLKAGGIACILGNLPTEGADIVLDVYVLAGAAINADDTIIAQEYISLNGNAQAKIVPATTLVQTKPAPVIAGFSSRGPNSLNPEILKPDITAPGVNILAAWTGGNSPTGLPSDHRRVAFNIISGTSMASPHVAGVAALLKNIYPTWSPAAIKSAIMTTASVVNNLNQSITTTLGNKANPFDFGSGHINPIAAADPGLVYETSPKDYALFLCGAGYSNSEIQLITGLNFTCGKKVPSISNLNYPSVSINMNQNKPWTVTRKVTNVASKASTYNVTVQAPDGILVEIVPTTLYFAAQGESKSFTLKFNFTVSKPTKSGYLFGFYNWFDGIHVVQSPIVVSTI
ncbi:hypothetical protein O6H91_05G129100 [Diphasiastrum complanatum]|uniref:Uncharacterized protein n=3 Tax=Diphasiastrum complanatum TaxID=34168 RepID=A0ACC2DTB7_DIPCM|nr:hypothetical protein O6H91_05G129100 [Diphasiastrum complanatum]KAJ7557503.1 hypothetical protein O6H91_05G129100 [Diphasiastrum complanatum]